MKLADKIKKLEAEVARLKKFNVFFHKLDKALGPDVTADKKIAAFKVLQEVAGEVMKRTMDDLMRAGNGALATIAIMKEKDGQ